MTKQLAVYGAAVMTTLLGLVMLWQFRSVIIYVLISLSLVAALRPLFFRLAGRHLLIRTAWTLLYLVALGGFGYLLFQVGELAVREIQQLAGTVSVRDEWRLAFWFKGSPFEQALIARLPPPSKLFEAFISEQGQLVPPVILSFTQSISSIVRGVFVILFLSIYWSLHQIHFERLWLSLLPSGKRIQAREVWQTIETDIGAYIRAAVIQCLLIGVLLGLGFWLLKSPYPVLLALAGALAGLIPMVGVVLTVILVLLVGLLTSVQLSMFTALYALVVLFVLGIWVKPRLFIRRWDNPILTLLMLVAMADAFGLLGVIVAAPISVVCQILWSHLVSRRTVAETPEQVSDLKERQQRVWKAIKAMDEPHLALVTNSMERLTRLIDKAEPILQAAMPAAPSDPSPQPQPVSAETGLPGTTKS